MSRRFIVRFRGSAPAKEIASKLHADELVHVVEETPKMMLVEAEEADLLGVVQPGPDVVIVPEQHYQQPDARPSISPEGVERDEPLKR
jgi:hypothetical protein